MSSTRPRSRTSRYWAPALSVGGIAIASRPTGTRSGHARTGSGMPASRSAPSGGPFSGSASASGTTRSASRVTLSGVYLRKGSVGVTPSFPACTPAPSRPRPPRVSIRSSSSPGATSRKSGCLCSSAAFAAARRDVPDLRLEVFGDGPDRAAAEAEAERLDVRGAVSFRGRRPQNEVEHAFAHAACVATASEREGYGLVVVEAAARGTPSVVVAGPENAAVELVADGVNGAVAEGSTPSPSGPRSSRRCAEVRLCAPRRSHGSTRMRTACASSARSSS